jgi:hypothetical protein
VNYTIFSVPESRLAPQAAKLAASMNPAIISALDRIGIFSLPGRWA